MVNELDLWKEYKSKVLVNDYKPKFHFHLDPYFSFEKNHEIIANLLFPKKEDKPSLYSFSFLPLMKTIVKTPRYKYYKDLGEYKLSTKKRPIFLTAHKDKYIYGYYSFLLNTLYQEKLSETSFNSVPIAYRSDLGSKCNIQFSKEVFDHIKSLDSAITILTDVSSFFDNIDHQILKKNWCKILGTEQLPADHFKVYKALTSYRYVVLNSFLKKFNVNIERDKPQNGSLLNLMGNEKFTVKLKKLNTNDLIVKNQPTKNGELKGIPQGLSISATLSNIYLFDFDEIINNYVTERGGLYRRYCDDIILVLPGEDFSEPLSLLKNEIVDQRDMVMKPSKTELAKFIRKNDSEYTCTTFDCIDIKNGEIEKSNRGKIQYLGFTFDGKDVLIRNTSISRFYRKMARRVRKTIRMAYSGSSKYKSSVIFRKQIYERYTHYGNRNFLKYVYDASSKSYTNNKGEEKEGHNSKKMRKQVSRHMEILDKVIDDKNLERFVKKINKGKKVFFKKWKK